MTLSAASANQRPRAVVSVDCAASRDMCRALVQSLSALAPSHIYRINPTPQPEGAFVVTLDLSEPEHARLRWQESGTGQPVEVRGQPAPELAEQLVTASPALTGALRAHPTPTAPNE